MRTGRGPTLSGIPCFQPCCQVQQCILCVQYLLNPASQRSLCLITSMDKWTGQTGGEFIPKRASDANQGARGPAKCRGTEGRSSPRQKKLRLGGQKEAWREGGTFITFPLEFIAVLISRRLRNKSYFQSLWPPKINYIP